MSCRSIARALSWSFCTSLRLTNLSHIKRSHGEQIAAAPTRGILTPSSLRYFTRTLAPMLVPAANRGASAPQNDSTSHHHALSVGKESCHHRLLIALLWLTTIFTCCIISYSPFDNQNWAPPSTCISSYLLTLVTKLWRCRLYRMIMHGFLNMWTPYFRSEIPINWTPSSDIQHHQRTNNRETKWKKRSQNKNRGKINEERNKNMNVLEPHFRWHPWANTGEEISD